MRSRQVFVSIILQNIAALKALFEKEWESILGNCDEFLYLGGNETSTHKLISESYLGKATIDTNTYGKSSGRNGNYSTNYQITGRELMTPDEVRMLDNRYALLFIRISTAVRKTPWQLSLLSGRLLRTFPIWKKSKPITSFFPTRMWKRC